MTKEDMNIVIVGHVDHGKSTLIGRLLADTESLPEGKLEQVKKTCQKNSKPFEYAFLLDALKDEQAQGITIDTARCFFKTQKRNYIIIDAPGHIEFLKNMITGAARAEAAILVIDAKEGVRENSKRHGYMLSMLGIKKIIVAVNKMDLVEYSRDIFENVVREYSLFLGELGVEPVMYIPISAFEGDNVAAKSIKMPWHYGMTVLEAMDFLPCEKKKTDKFFRMPVQDVYKFTKNGDDRRIVAGTVETGKIKKGDSVVFYPSGKKSIVKSIEAFPQKAIDGAEAGQATGFTLFEQIYIKRGEIMCIDGQQPPNVASRLYVNLFWLGKDAFCMDKKYSLKIGTQKVGAVLEKISSVMNSSDLSTEKKNFVACNEVAECVLRTDKPIAFDLVENMAETSRFVIVDNYEISGGGIILKTVDDKEKNVIDKVLLRNYKWEHSEISRENRAEQYSQKPVMMILTGEADGGKKAVAKALEKSLVLNGRFAYYLGIGSFLYGVDSDIKLQNNEEFNHDEHIRRFAEVANILMDAGLILIVTARMLTQRDLDLMRAISESNIEIVWVGDEVKTDLKADMVIDADTEKNVLMLKEYLKDKGYIFKF